MSLPSEFAITYRLCVSAIICIWSHEKFSKGISAQGCHIYFCIYIFFESKHLYSFLHIRFLCNCRVKLIHVLRYMHVYIDLYCHGYRKLVYFHVRNI